VKPFLRRNSGRRSSITLLEYLGLPGPISKESKLRVISTCN
jgi:hypothetical protein